MKDKFLKEAIRIGDRLITTARRDSHGIFWETPNSYNRQITWSSSESIYGGNCGIVLFLLALYGVTKKENFLRAAQDAMNWVYFYCKNHSTNDYSLFSGRMGVCFTYIRLAEVTKNKQYLNKALAIAKRAHVFLKEPFHINDITNGLSGTLLSLIFLYAATQELWVLICIQNYIDTILENASFDKRGLFWDSIETQIRPLCGFAHGPAGIGFVFLELAHYFNNPAFYYVAEQAFAYEDYYFNNKTKNWPDFRLHMDTQEEEEKLEALYKKGKMKRFNEQLDKNQWCHGAAGIGLSRLRYQELMKNKKFEKDITYAYNKILLTKYKSFTLCHGYGGSADFFIEKYLLSHNQEDLKPAVKIAKKILKSSKINNKFSSGIHYKTEKYPEDPSLFNGSAGIGYFLLQVTAPENVVSILAPRVITENKEKKLEHFSLYFIKRTLLANMFPRTIQYVEEIEPIKLQKYLLSIKNNNSEVGAFRKFIVNLSHTLDGPNKQFLLENLILELKKYEFQEQKENNAILYIKSKINDRRAESIKFLDNKSLLNCEFKLSSEVKLVSTNINHLKYILHKLTPYEVEEVIINQFCYLVLNSFKESSLVKDAVKNVYQNYKKKAKENYITNQAINQIRQAINYGILIDVLN